MYQLFHELNPTFESKINAFVSQAFCPDLKLISLWSMKAGKSYIPSQLRKEVLGFLYPKSFSFPSISQTVLLNYQTYLEKTGMVLRSDSKTYQITDAGLDFAHPAAAAACYLVNLYSSKLKENKPAYCSLQRIFSVRSGKYAKGYATYRIAKLLASKPEKEFGYRDIIEGTGLDRTRVSRALRALGKARIIDHESICKESKGKRQRDQVIYKVIDREISNLNSNQVCQRIKGLNRNLLTKIIRKIRGDLDAMISAYSLASELGSAPNKISTHLGALRRLGYLDSRFSWDVRAIVRANENTLDLWHILLEPLERAMKKLDPSAHPDFCTYEEMYSSNQMIKVKHIRNWFRIYQKERAPFWSTTVRLEDLILTVLKREGREMKASRIREDVEKIYRGVLSDRSVQGAIRRLFIRKKIEKVRHGYYKIARGEGRS